MHPSYDKDRYIAVREACVFCAEYWRGTIADVTHPARVMTFVGTPTFALMNGLPVLRNNTAGDGTASAVEARIVDVTGAFSVEWCGTPTMGGPGGAVLIQQAGPVSGGFSFDWDPMDERFFLWMLDNVGAIARSVSTPVGSAVVGLATHGIITSSAGGTAGTAAIRGVPVAVTLAGAGVVANCNANTVVSAARTPPASGIVTSLLVRAAAVSWGREDQTALYGAASVLTGSEV
jgi:hypothetical protein